LYAQIVTDPRKLAPRTGRQTASLRGRNRTVALKPAELEAILHQTAATTEQLGDLTSPTVEMVPLQAKASTPTMRFAGGSGALPPARGNRHPRETLRVADIKRGSR